jgi:putative membrane protein
MAFVMLVFWIIVVAAIIALIRSDHGRGQDRFAGRADDPEHILAERFARGEIDADEYQQRRDVLRAR